MIAALAIVGGLGGIALSLYFDELRARELQREYLQHLYTWAPAAGAAAALEGVQLELQLHRVQERPVPAGAV